MNDNPFTEEIRRLWHAAERPPVREIANRTSSNISYATINSIINGTTGNPRWVSVALITEALGGDLVKVRELYDQYVGPYATKTGHTPAAVNTQTEAINNLAAAINNLADAIRGTKPAP